MRMAEGLDFIRTIPVIRGEFFSPASTVLNQWLRLLACSYPRRIAPKRFQIVSLPNVLPHHVHNHIKKIQNNPRGLESPVNGPRPEVVFLFKLIRDFVNNRTQVRLARAGGQYEVISH